MSSAWRRRRLLALGGLGAAFAAKLATGTATPAHAAGYVVGSPPGYTPIDSQSDGVQGYAVGANVAGTFGRNNDLNGVGVHGVAPSGVGAYGESTTGTGVSARSASGTAIEGWSSTGDGVRGYTSGNLKYALSGSGSGQAHGVVGVSANQYGVSGVNQNGTEWAGAFFNAQATSSSAGKKGLFVQGDFLVLNGTKNNGVVTQNHGPRLLYAVEATGSYYEDFGRARLQSGQVRVDLEPIFAETVTTTVDYHVFLTPRGDSKGLFIATQDSQGFTVQEAQGGTGNFEFDYRIVARVRGHETTRLGTFTLPAIPNAPSSPGVPNPSVTPTGSPAATPSSTATPGGGSVTPTSLPTTTPQSSPQAP